MGENGRRGHAIVGDPSHCAELIQRWCELFGLTTFSGLFHFGGMPQEQALRSIRLFGERVMPALAPQNVAAAS